jgi:DNA-binding NtrC family response regulator
MSPRPSTPQTTAPSKSTGPGSASAFRWAIHWVLPCSRICALEPGETRIGRDAESEIAFDDVELSRSHARITTSTAVCQLVDLGSRNGCFVNGQRVSSAQLENGSVLQVGSNVGVLVHAPNATESCRDLARSPAEPYLGSAKLKHVVEQARELAPRRDPVFVNGASGSGKETIARILHDESGRTGRLVALNCSTVRGDLAVSAIFGHKRGSFSGATADSPGAALQAAGGTLFLDEIAELPVETQPLLLRFLQSGELTAVGTSVAKHVDVRVVCATHQDLYSRSKSGKFREDLYYRLAPHELRLPRLRERREDILELFERFAGRPRGAMTRGFVTRLLLKEYDGNVRELQNLALHLTASRGAERVWDSHALPASLAGEAAEPPEPRKPEQLEEAEWKALHTRHRGNAASIALATGFSPSAVKRYLAKHRLRAKA